MRLLAYLQSLAWCIFLVHGNVEKTIFLAPEAIQIPQQHPNLQHLNLQLLSPSNPQLRRQLPAAFASPADPKGISAWFLLDRLKQHQRYEVRICWAATVSVLDSLTKLFNISIYLPSMTSIHLSGALTRRTSNQLPSHSSRIRYPKSSTPQS